MTKAMEVERYILVSIKITKMFKGPQGMSLAGNASAASAAADANTSAATATADKTKMCASSLIFRATK